MTHENIAASAHLIDGKYMKDRKGRLVPVDLVPAHDFEMDAFVRSCIAGAFSLQQQMIEFKRRVYGDCDAFIKLLDEKFNVKRGGLKGNASFTTYDGALQITISINDLVTFGPEIQSAKSLIDECLEDWSEGANENLLAIIRDAFVVDQQGKLSMSRIVSLLRIDIKDERWPKIKNAISDGLVVNGTKTYLNFRQRNAEGKMVDIPLAMAAL
ncbi:DUF3164 family protein [Enterobacter kobei]